MTRVPEDAWLLPVGLRNQATEALRINRRLLDYLNKYLWPTGISESIVPAIRRNLRELRTVNEQVSKLSAGWLDCGEE